MTLLRVFPICAIYFDMVCILRNSKAPCFKVSQKMNTLWKSRSNMVFTKRQIPQVNVDVISSKRTKQLKSHLFGNIEWLFVEVAVQKTFIQKLLERRAGKEKDCAMFRCNYQVYMCMEYDKCGCSIKVYLLHKGIYCSINQKKLKCAHPHHILKI